ncbi:hypothetical protein KC19_10G109900 [Ceratodon purpureus]|uniref:Pectinesterase n=1 Tax=Ceratodon purpureus TaxID=3225 RepID=A0A8T0GKH7_CERPU|nr:hypothetical protein KC19_10G109900 [Ceratodon purpureus]
MGILLEDAAMPLVREVARPEPGLRGRVLASILFVVAGVAVVMILFPWKQKSGIEESRHGQLVGVEAFDAACSATLYPSVCVETLLPNYRAHSTSSKGLTEILISSASRGVARTLAAVLANRGVSRIGFWGERVCHSTLVSSTEQLEASLAAMNSTHPRFDDIKMRISAAMEFHTTCIDALMETRALEAHTVATKQHTEKLLSNALAFVIALSRFGNSVDSWQSILKSPSFLSPSMDEPKPWISREQQEELMLDDPPIDVVVAKDGSGLFKSIQAAIDAAPKTGNATAKRYVIRIKAGVYNEQITVSKKATNFMFIGDGAEKTIITGNKSVALTPGMTTFLSASLIVEGTGFIGKAFTARNTAGAAGHQAVAMRVSADMAAFYQCSFDGYQDTLYTHTFRQFYRETTVSGTVDFIFGNAAVAFQSCTLVAKKSTLPGQQNTYTAQGRTDPGQITGMSFQSCTFDATPELKASAGAFKTYLGRPWKAYSTHVNLKCNLLEHIDPAGWLPWNTSDFGLRTSFFAEWKDFGPGAATAKRAWWSKQITDASVAGKFQAVPFTQADQWVPATSIPLTTSLP